MNAICSPDGGVLTSFGFDDLRRRTAQGRGNLTSSGSTSYWYASTNRLVYFPGGYIYNDPLDRRLDVSTEQSWAMYDGTAEIGQRGYDQQVKRRYVRGPGADEIIMWYEGGGTSDKRWLIQDERGSVVALTNAGGTATAINRYDEYGIPAAGNVGRFQYTGQAWIPALGMYDYKARTYSPTLGRFLQTDPIGYGDGLNWYNYVGADPVNQRDPSGLNAEVDIVVNAPAPNDLKEQEIVVTGPRIVEVGSFIRFGNRGFYGNFSNGSTGGSAPKPGAAPEKKRVSVPCSSLISAPGTITTLGSSVEITIAIGFASSSGTFSGRFDNSGKFFGGSYTSFGFTAGLAGGAALTSQKFGRLSDFVGLSDTFSASIGPLGGSSTYSTSGKYIGYSGQVGLGGPRAGVSTSMTNTDLSMCFVLQ